MSLKVLAVRKKEGTMAQHPKDVLSLFLRLKVTCSVHLGLQHFFLLL